MTVLNEIAAERKRQIAKGYDAAHDDEHVDGEIALAATLYAIPYEMPGMDQEKYIRLHMLLDIGYEWDDHKPEPNRRRRLVKAAAMIVAEIERLDRKTSAAPSDAVSGKEGTNGPS